jgi:ABC-type Fe3+/spermidine/putrescine transport system ATPase subunit
MSDYLIEVKDVSKSYGGSPALVGVSLTVAAGENLGLLGPSGGGKSTLLRLLAGLDAPTSGAIFIGGQLASDSQRILMAPHRRTLTMVFQDLALWPNLTAEQNVRLGLSGTSLDRRDQSKRAAEALDLCGILQMAKRHPGQLSGGEQQRVALARAFAPRPRLLLLDEPFANLDLLTKRRLLNDLADYARVCRTTVLFVTHEPCDARVFCQSVAILEEGRTVSRGDAVRLRNPSEIPLTASFAFLLAQPTINVPTGDG